MFHSIKRFSLILGAAAIALTVAGCTPSKTGKPASQTVPVPVTTNTQPTEAVKTFTVEGSSFAFSLKTMTVKKGDKVKIVFKNIDGFHDWVIDEFSARTPQIKGGTTAEVMFTADKTGTFEYYCSVGQHRQNGMRGNLIVE